MNVSIPQREQYADMAAPALPFVGIAMRVTPSSFAMETAMTSPRALNEPVGSRPSSFTQSPPPAETPSSAAIFGADTCDACTRGLQCARAREGGRLDVRVRAYDWRCPLAERDAVLISAHGEKLAPFPERWRPLGENFASEDTPNGF